MQDTKLCHTDRQLLVRSFTSVKDQAMSGTVHRFHRELFLVDFQLEHVLGVVLPMARGFPELGVEDVGRADWNGVSVLDFPD